MQNVLATWQAMDMRRRVIVVLATLATLVAVLALARSVATPRMALLYSGLDPAASGEVITALEARGVAYAVAGDSIRVDAAQRDELRMLLAGEGLPASGGAGYELLDGLSGFGTTAQMFDAAYWRAKEGELARTILAMPGMRAARVHIAQTPDAPFLAEAPPTASVTVTTRGERVTADQARALRHLVAAAVSGLRTDDVAVIDSLHGLVGTEANGPLATADARAAEMKRNVERLLAARLGAGRAVVEVSLDLVTESESLTERRFDPQSRVPISQETQESSENSTDPGGAVTVASNLPEGDAAGGEPGRSARSETRERVNFEVSETSRAVERPPGAIRRLTVAVLVDGAPSAAGEPPAPRDEAELQVLQELVASAVGFDAERGDVLTIRSLPFEPLAIAGTGAEAGWLAALTGADQIALAQLAVIALVILALAAFVLRPLLLSRQSPTAEVAAPLPIAPPLFDEPPGFPVLNGVIDDPAMMDNGEPDAADPVARLRRLIEERQSETVEILRSWMEADREKA